MPNSSLNFSSDGCSLFPDGIWFHCCFEHDIAYWQGGSEQQKTQADDALYHCVLKTTDNSTLAHIMYLGVKIGGSPYFPTKYRWSYGWQYGRGFQALNVNEHQSVLKKLKTLDK